MKAYNTYSTIMFTPHAMRAVVAHLSRKLPALQRQFDFDTIVVTGKSGMALGFALSMVSNIHVVAVRKGESSHGDVIEGSGHEFERYAFFDDCIASGETLRRVEAELGRFADARGVARPTHKLNILYNDFRDETADLILGKTYHMASYRTLPGCDRLNLTPTA